MAMRRPYARKRAAATTSRQDRLRATMARMDAKMKAAKEEKAKKAAAKKAADAKKKAKNQAARKTAAAKRPVAPKNPRTGRSRGSVDSKTNMDFDASPRNTNPNPRARALSLQRDKTGGVKTKAGTYNTFKKKSAAAGSFRSAFATARKAGKKTFTWNGKRYTTEQK